MQDRFVGDIGDFGKYGLLRALTGIYPEAKPSLSLGVVWYLNVKEPDSRGDGQRLSYLDKPDHFRDCDPELFDCLSDIASTGQRSLASVQESGILGSAATFTARARRLASRIVFLDPDKGIAFSRAQNSAEHVWLAEVERLADRKQTVVIYQSFGRQRGDTHENQMERWAAEIERRLPRDEAPSILRFRPWHPRAFIVLPAADHKAAVEERLTNLLGGPWGRHFTEYRPA